jgi:hypothetical protein
MSKTKKGKKKAVQGTRAALERSIGYSDQAVQDQNDGLVIMNSQEAVLSDPEDPMDAAEPNVQLELITSIESNERRNTEAEAILSYTKMCHKSCSVRACTLKGKDFGSVKLYLQHHNRAHPNSRISANKLSRLNTYFCGRCIRTFLLTESCDHRNKQCSDSK